MKKNGFTLVELMVVIAVIGVLAAFSFPRLQSAADRKRAAEAPKVLLSIAGAQEAFKIINGCFLPLNAQNAPAANWRRLGLNAPESINFVYTTTVTPPDCFTQQGGVCGCIDPTATPPTPTTFLATAALRRNLFSVNVAPAEIITINHADCRFAGIGLRRLVPSFVGTPPRDEACP